MTTQAKPKFQKTTFFNSSFYDTEINNNITKQEASNTYLEKPINYNTGIVNSVLTLTNTSPIQASWTTPATAITNYTNYNNTLKTLISNVSGTPTTITDLVLSSGIGSSLSQKFKLPTLAPQFTGVSLRVSSLSPLQTEWEIPQALTPYVSYNSTSKQLEDNGALGSSIITDLVVSSSIGSSTAQKFVLPSNSSTSTIGQVLSISNATSKTSQWITIPTQISDYVRFNPSTYDLSRLLNGSASSITLLTVSTLGRDTTQRFGLPTNSSTAPADFVLSINVAGINNGGAPSTIWKTIPTQISSYVNYNNANSNLISNVSGTPSTITSISISGLLTTGNINSGAINANANLIETTGGLKSRALTIQNTSSVNVATISNLGELVCTSIQNNNNTVNCGNITSGTINSGAINANANLIETTGNLQSRGLVIKNTSDINVATISNLGGLVCTSIQNNGNTVNCGNITSGTINSGSINANANLIETTGNLQSRGLIIKNTTNGNVCTISNQGNINITGAYTGNDYIFTSYGDIQTQNGNIYTNNGNLQSRGLIIKNTSDINVSTISNTGALVCTTIQNNGNTLNCGNITSGTINTQNNTINAGTSSISGGSILSSVFNSGAPGSDLDIGTNQVAGNLTIGNNATRTGSVNICTLASNNSINIGNASSTQQLNINRPIRMPGNLPFTNGLEIGYSLNTGMFFSATNIPSNAPVPNVRSDTPIPSGNLVNGAVYLITYTILILPQATLDLSKFQYGIFSGVTFISGFNQNHSMVTSTGNSMRFNTSETYSYSGSGHFAYSSGVTYNLSFIMAFLATAPIVQTNIDLIRIR